MKRILCLFDFLSHTGFSTVSTNILSRLKDIFPGQVEYEIIASNYFGEKKAIDKYTKVMPAYNAGEKPDPFGRYHFLKMLQDDERGYDGVFIIQDPGVIQPLIPIMKDIKKARAKAGKKQFKSVFYFPVDGPVLPEWFTHYDFFDRAVPYTEFAKNAVLSVRPGLKNFTPILHGVDVNVFQPLAGEERAHIRRSMFKENAKKDIICIVNRNQPRKDIPTSLLGFKEYLKVNPNAFLYLHLNPLDNMGWNIPILMQQLGLKEGKHFQYMAKDLIDNYPGPDYVNQVYNSCDVMLNTTTGEGFGLTVLEAFAARCPVIAPLHTSLIELFGTSYETKRFYPLEVYEGAYCASYDSMFRNQCDYSNVSERLEYFFDCKRRYPSYINEIKSSAYEFAQKLSWDNIADQWASEVFKPVFNLSM